MSSLKFTSYYYCLWFLMIYSFSFSQNTIEFQQLSGENVSTQSITYAIKQDSVGNVWIGSEEGVLKHNSKYYKTYNTYNGLPHSVSNRTTEVFIDSQQRIWIGLQKGVCLYDDALDKFNLIGSNSDINPSLVNAITEDENGSIWVGGFNGIWLYKSNSTDNKLTRIVSNHLVQALYSYKRKIIFGTTKGLFVYDTTTDSISEIELNSDKNNITSIGFSESNIIVGTKSGKLFKCNLSLKKGEIVPFEKGLNRINDIVVDASNNIYLATDGDGLYYVDKSFSIINHYEENSDNQKSISSNGIYDLELGKEDILWIATYGGGVNYFDSNRLPFQKIQHQFNYKNSIVANFTRAIEKDKNDNLWFGTKNGISIWNTKNNTWKHINHLSSINKTSQDIVLALESDGEFMWVGTYNKGLFKININNFKSTHYNSQFPNNKLLKKIYVIYKDVLNNVWVGGIEGDLAVISPENEFHYYPIQQIRSILNNKEGHIFTSGSGGVYEINHRKKEFKLIESLKPNENSLAFTTINTLHETEDGRLFLATSGEGLVFFNPKNNEIKKLTIKSGMPSDIIQGMIAISQSNIWVSTAKGLVNVVTTKKDTTINVFDKKDGLSSTEFNYGSYKKLNDSILAFGGVDGVTLFNHKYLKGNIYKPQLAFDEFKLSNKVINPGEGPLKKRIDETESISLKYIENSFELRFTGVLHSSSSKVNYTWKLEGFNEDWSTPSSVNFANFTNLNPGDYIFKVKACNKYGDFGEERSIRINIASPWWATNKAFFLYFLLALIVIYLIVYFTNAIVKKKHADEQIDFFNNITHEIKTPLTILLSSLDNATDGNPSNNESKKRIKTTVKRINSLFEQMLNFHKVTSQEQVLQYVSEINLLNHFNQIIHNFEPLTKERNIEVVINNHWGNSLFHYDTEILDKIVLNLISNAIKYSLEDGEIFINLKKTKLGELKIEIEDNGLGIPKDQQKYILKRYYRARNVINSQRPGTGLGLIMVKKLIEKTGGSISFVSEENKGTTFTVLLKDKKEKYKQNTLVTQHVNEIDNQLELDEFSNSKILIVEDNDELRDILVNTLGVYFQIYEAKNGIEGLEKAHQIFPDIILTDLIMPEMDGMQMARKLKDDINLNHIPVFMLTVLQSSKQKLDSIESGISEYLEKPVNLKFLLAKMANSLKWQQKLRKIYIHENDSDSATLYRNKHDQTFLENLEHTTLENIENNSFSVHDLSKSVGMSRTSLYMKLKNLVDLSPQDFIIHAKLKHAKNLLIKGENSIKEIAYSSGFSNPKYFSTSFKKFYGVSPSSFLESLQKK